MEAGRELDALVAEKVMGWKRRRFWPPNPQHPHSLPDGSGDWVWSIDGSLDSRGSFLHRWAVEDREVDLQNGDGGATGFHPSEDIAAAWGVREQVKTWSFSRRLAFKAALQREVSERLSVKDALVADKEILLLVEPADICFAALKAVGG